MKVYNAMIWMRDSDKLGQRLSVLVESLEEAKEKLEKQYGEGNVFYLRNEEDAERPR